MKFADILATLPAIDGIAALMLLDAAGEPLQRLDNKPGTAGSVRVYHALVKRFGHIDKAAAREGLALYAEHTDDARAHPGKHPNIDRLLAIAEQDAPGLRVRIVLDDSTEA
ncbi:DUF2322 family protein [Vogesella alkaliphila]|uniref:DUF2322 family protein n=1 Tax=Vogesella alkaliphila TaxID=1193621 RepID=A0ABQ2YEJ4_9NEIS|nr:DUF2322 family protein [Vogesella alkaliphila]GGX81446.1 hypothetical protein GCM10011290_06030 [Vogesella alkaliphila]